MVRAHPHSAGALNGVRRRSGGRSKGGLSTKIHATCDALGNPTSFHLTEGQAHDLDSADVLLPLVQADTVLGDGVTTRTRGRRNPWKPPGSGW